MKITDEMLSAFLDAELPAAEMEHVRVALETDDNLVVRLAELAEADQWVTEYAQQIDSTPIPEKLIQLANQIDQKLQVNEPEAINKVVQLSAWKKATQGTQKYYQVAAGIALVVGVGLITTLNTSVNDLAIPSNIAKVLDTAPSGTQHTLSDNSVVESQLSFASIDGQLCRQYQVLTSAGSQGNIACKNGSSWELKAQSGITPVNPEQVYQAASNNNALDKLIDTLIDGPAFDRSQEQAAINNQWQLSNSIK
ncbi:anti-sigma factor family protein [Paraglaciecola sp. 2405UD69-4]|uniref:anti-sigma factor family protein n=1 Tax=Paraglaciecola sp. 2405UD69-4 TaxID=3391836 RepID=UPI0039C982A7